MNTSAPAVQVRQLSKNYGSVQALKNVDLTIAAGEYFVLLGPSGGGKTTLLRTIGGFHKPTSGQVWLNGAEVSHLPPDKRPTSMVFQSYALFPHMNVLGNVGYGLSLAKLAKSEVRDRSMAMLEMVGLKGYEDRRPHELSGGQQQRVQLARALVLGRNILLLDEPLAALDAQLRKDMCLELKHLQQKVGITFIHVTHNQEEAMTVADRIALIADGELVEHGAARDIYRAPERRFTASFVGENNLLAATVTAIDGGTATVDVCGQTLIVDRRDLPVAVGDAVTLSVRSELVDTVPADSADTAEGCSLAGTYTESVYLGLTLSHRVSLSDGTEVVARRIGESDTPDLVPGQPLRLCWRPGALRLHVV